MDPLDMRIPEHEIRAVDPLVRARLNMEAGEAAEERARVEALRSARDLAEVAAIQQEAADRVELANKGYLEREAERARAEREQVRQGRIAELVGELARLDPQQFGDKGVSRSVMHLETPDGGTYAITAGGRTGPGSIERELAAHRAGQEHFQRILSRRRAGEIDMLERQLGLTGPGPEAMRKYDGPDMVTRVTAQAFGDF